MKDLDRLIDIFKECRDILKEANEQMEKSLGITIIRPTVAYVFKDKKTGYFYKVTTHSTNDIGSANIFSTIENAQLYYQDFLKNDEGYEWFLKKIEIKEK